MKKNQISAVSSHSDGMIFYRIHAHSGRSDDEFLIILFPELMISSS